MQNIKNNTLKFLAFVISSLAILTVNSTCYTVFGQIKEPKTLQRFKKIH